MAQSAEELLELMERGSEGLTGRLVEMLDQEGDPQRLGEAYSMWVLPAALMIFAAKADCSSLYEEIQRATDEMERSLENYLERPCRERLVQVAADWMGARAASRRLVEELSA